MHRPGGGIPRIGILLLSLILSPWASLAQAPSDAGKTVAEDSGAVEKPGKEVASALDLPRALSSSRWLDMAPAIPRLGVEVGAFYSFDRQSSLSNSFSQTTTVLRDLNRGTTSTTVNAGDPRLNNRKFEYRLDLEQSGIRVPITLPRLAGARTFSVTFGLEAAVAEVSFDVLDQNQPELSTSFSGDGATFGVGFDVATCVTVACKWIASAGYWYRYLPAVNVDRSPPVAGSPSVAGRRRDGDFAVATEAAAGLAVVADAATLSREAHELSFRFGYDLETEKRRYAPYTGVLFRRSEAEIDDLLTFRSEELGLETTFTSTSRFDSDAVLGIAGVEGQLSKSFSGRLESFFGDGDHGLRFQVGWSWWGKGDPELAQERDRRQREKREKQARRRFDKWEKRFAAITPWLLARIQEIEREYQDGWKNLEVVEESGGPSYRIDGVKALLADTEENLVAALSSRRARRHRDLTPLRDYVIYRYDRTLRQLAAADPPVASAQNAAPRNVVPAVLSDPGRSLVLPAQDVTQRPLWERALIAFGEVFPFLRTAIEREECRYVVLHFTRGELASNTVLALVPYSSANTLPDPKNRLEFEDSPLPVPRGVHGYRLYASRGDLEAAKQDRRLDRGPRPLLACSADSDCALDLVERPCSELGCTISPDTPAIAYCLQGGELLPDHCFSGRPACN